MRHTIARDFSMVGCKIGSHQGRAGRYRAQVSIDAYSARFDGRFMLAVSGQGASSIPTTVDAVINLGKAALTGILNLRGARLHGTPVALDAGGLQANGFYISKGFKAEGAVYAHLISIHNIFSAEGGTVRATLPSAARRSRHAIALCLRYAHINGLLQLGAGFRAEGVVDLKDARINGNIELTGGTFENREGVALLAQNLRVTGDVLCSNPPNVDAKPYARKRSQDGSLLDTTRFCGEVGFANAQIDGEVDLARCLFQRPLLKTVPASSAIALSFYRAKIGRRLRLGRGFRATGIVALEEASIGGSLDLQAGWFINPGGIALAANRIHLGGDVVMPRKWTPKDLHSEVGSQDSRACTHPENWKEYDTPYELACQLLGDVRLDLRISSDEALGVYDARAALADLISTFARRHSDDKVNAYERQDLPDTWRDHDAWRSCTDWKRHIEERFMAIGLVSFKASYIEGDVDSSGGLFFSRPFDLTSTTLRAVEEAVAQRASHELANWNAIDLSHATIGRALYLTRWVPRGPTTASAPSDALRPSRSRITESDIFPIAVSGTVDLTATTVGQLHLSISLFNLPRDRDTRILKPVTTALLVDGLTYLSIVERPEDLAECRWFLSGYKGASIQPYEQLAAALRRQGNAYHARLALLSRRSKRWRSRMAELLLLNIVRLTFPWGRSAVGLALLIAAGTWMTFTMLEGGTIIDPAHAAHCSASGRPDCSSVSLWTALRYTVGYSVPLIPAPDPPLQFTGTADLFVITLNIAGLILTSTLIVGIARVFKRE